MYRSWLSTFSITSLYFAVLNRVHHVRSNDVNIAVNIWWRHGVEVNFSHCDARPGRTIKDLIFIGFGALHEAQEKLIR